MNTIQTLFQQAQLAEAAYANLDGITSSTDPAMLQSRLINLQPDGSYDFSPAQAAEFVKQWRVVSHQPDTSSGFSATLFERLNATQQSYQPPQYTLAIRGSSEWADWSADFFDLALGGQAYGQVQSMINYVLRLQAGSTQNNRGQTTVSRHDYSPFRLSSGRSSLSWPPSASVRFASSRAESLSLS